MSKTFEQALLSIPDVTGEGGKVLALSSSEDTLEFIEGSKDDVALWSGSAFSGLQTIASGYNFSDFSKVIIYGGSSVDPTTRSFTTIPISVWTTGSILNIHGSVSALAYVNAKYSSETTFTPSASDGTYVILGIWGVY